MSNLAPESIRNVVIVAHGGTDKAALIDTMLYQAKAISRPGSADKKDWVMSTEPEEAERGIAITPHAAHLTWNETSVNMLDTPGYFNFLESTRGVLPGVEGAVFVFSGVDGAKAEAERLWDMVQESELPTIGFLNCMEDEQADLGKALTTVSETLGTTALALTMPIGEKENISGVVNLIHRKAWTFKDGEAKECDIPEELKDDIESFRLELIEKIAETDDSLIEKYLEGEELSEEELDRGLKTAIHDRTFIPVFCGSSAKNIGVSTLLDSIVEYMPNPLEREKDRPFVGSDPDNKETEVTRTCDASEPFSAIVLKTTIDPFSGKVSIVRVVSGEMSNNQPIYNATQDRKQKTGHVYKVQGKELEQVGSLSAGDIGAFAKLDDTKTGDTLCDVQKGVSFTPTVYAKPGVFYAVTAAEDKGEDKVASGLARLIDEDPTLRLHRDEQTLEMILSGMGQVHLEVALQRLERKFGGKAKLKEPKIPYKETIRKGVKMQGKLKKQTGGHGQFANCWLEVEPLPRDQGFEFVDLITGGIIPKQFIPSIEKGVIEAMKAGSLCGYPVVDVKVSVYDGSFHSVDSSDFAFQTAGGMAFKGANEQASPVLLEPIMSMEVIVSDDYTGDCMKDLSSRRGKVLGMDSKKGKQAIKAEVPLSEILDYGNSLSAITSGRGTYTMELCAYSEVPDEIADKVVKAKKAESEDKEDEKGKN